MYMPIYAQPVKKPVFQGGRCVYTLTPPSPVPTYISLYGQNPHPKVQLIRNRSDVFILFQVNLGSTFFLFFLTCPSPCPWTGPWNDRENGPSTCLSIALAPSTSPSLETCPSRGRGRRHLLLLPLLVRHLLHRCHCSSPCSRKPQQQVCI